MADAKVKNMLKQFETANDTDSMSTARDKKPELTVKPVLQRFQQNNSSSSDPTMPGSKPAGVRLMGLGGAPVALKPVNSNSSNKPSLGRESSDKKRVDVPAVFQNGKPSNAQSDSSKSNGFSTHSYNNNNNNNNNNSAASSSDNNNNKPATIPKFPKMALSNVKMPGLAGKTDNSIRPALVPKPNVGRSDSMSASSVSSVSSSTSSASVASRKTSSSTSSADATVSPNPSSPPGDSSGGFDFRKLLKKVDTTSSAPPTKRILSGASSNSSTSSDVTSPTSSSSKPVSTWTPRIPLESSFVENINAQRPKAHEDQDDIVERKSDGKKFRKLSFMPLPINAPEKPRLPENVDLTSIREEFHRAKSRTEANSDKDQEDLPPPPIMTEEEEDDGEIYQDGCSEQEVFTPRPPPKPGAGGDKTAQRISVIPEMLPEEEGIDMPVYDDTPAEEEIYDDAVSTRDVHTMSKTGSKDEPTSPTETEQDKKKRLKEEANARKKEEKERKEKEKREKEEEKKRKKKEEEEMKMKKNFNLTGNEKMVGEGVIKQDGKGGGLTLRVKKGQIVTIVRLDSNPPNKWLIKANDQYGYVDSANIEVDPNIIRQAMTGQATEEFDQPTYDDVPEEMGSCVPSPDEIDDELIYEECA